MQQQFPDLGEDVPELQASDGEAFELELGPNNCAVSE
jgi:hypothetical protein